MYLQYYHNPSKKLVGYVEIESWDNVEFKSDPYGIIEQTYLTVE